MARGGTNHKGGRPKGSIATHTLKAQTAKAKLIELVEAEIVPIVMALIEKANKGDSFAARELFDRAWGKSHQATDLTVKGKPTIIIESVIAQKYGINERTDSDSQ